MKTFKKEVFISINIVIRDQEKADMVTTFLFCFDQIFSWLFSAYLLVKEVKQFFNFVSYKLETGIRVGGIFGNTVVYGVG